MTLIVVEVRSWGPEDAGAEVHALMAPWDNSR